MLTDRQRIELALPTRMLFTIAASQNFSCFDAAGEVLDEEGAAIVTRLRGLLKGACLEPIADLPDRQALKVARRIERTHAAVTEEWEDQAAVKVGLAILYFAQALIEAEALILYEGSPVAEAVDLLLPMVEHGIEDPTINRSARKAARRLLRHCRDAGLYPGVEIQEPVDA